MLNERDFLNDLFRAALAAADPAICLPRFLPARPKGRMIVVGAGKAAAAMAAAAEEHYDGAIEGLVITRYGYVRPTRKIEVVEAAHPVPDQAGLDAAERILKMVENLTADDMVLFLASGGGSALMSVPAPGIAFADKQALHKALVLSGANITEINTVRKRLSAVKGGRLAAACGPARIHTLVISDVPGDDPAVVASGPTIRDTNPPERAQQILAKYKIAVPDSVKRHLDRREPAPDSAHDFARDAVQVVSRAADALKAAATFARANGVEPEIWGDALEGEAREVGAAMAKRARDVKGPSVLLSGGELTVTVKAKGRGGPNTEFLLGLALALGGAPNIHALSCDTDGIDGSEDNAGAIVTPDTLARAKAANLNALQYLANNDAYGFFNGLGDLVVTGPTCTNVNDFRAVLVT
ncbi:MAG: glycerate kinase [Rhodospirillales bacterium]|nr:glycerate kinase [Rhodospirillales bacterium]